MRTVFPPAAVLWILVSGALFADGIMISVDTGNTTTEAVAVPETDQRGFIYWDAESGLQRLVLEVRTAAFSGDSVWLIPIPHQPTDAQGFLDGSVEERPADGLDALFAATEPEVNVVAHQVTFEFHGPGMGFACAAAAPGDPTELGATTEEVAPPSPWGERSTESYNLSLYVGSSFDEFLSLLASEIGGAPGERVADLVAAQQTNLSGYFGTAAGVAGDGEPGPFSMLVARGKRTRETAVTSVLQIDFPTEAPFFALTVSRGGFSEAMAVTLLVASRHALEPDATVEPYLMELSLDAYYYGDSSAAEYGNETGFDGSVYVPDFPQFAPADLAGAEFSAETARAIDLVAQRAAVFGRQAVLGPPEVAAKGFGSVEAGTNTLPYTTDLPAEARPQGYDLWLSRYRRVYGAAAELQDVEFTATTAEPFVGRVDVHVSVEAEHTSGDLSLLLALAFPGWVLVRRGRRRLSRPRQPGAA